MARKQSQHKRDGKQRGWSSWKREKESGERERMNQVYREGQKGKKQGPGLHNSKGGLGAKDKTRHQKNEK